MANFKKITFTLKAGNLPDDPQLTKALDKIGKYHFKEVKVNRWETTITGEAANRKVVDRLAKALNANVDGVLYHFEFNCKPRVTQATLAEMLGWRTFDGLKLLISQCKFNDDRNIILAVGYATREEAIKELKRKIQ